jgi:hypothetical protein
MFLGATWLRNISYVPQLPTYVPRFLTDEHLSIFYSEAMAMAGGVESLAKNRFMTGIMLTGAGLSKYGVEAKPGAAARSA